MTQKTWYKTKYNFVKIIYNRKLKNFCIESKATIAKKHTELCGFWNKKDCEEFLNIYLKNI